MRRTAALAAIASVGVGAGIAIFSAQGTSGQTPSVSFSKQTLMLMEKDTNDFAFVDNPPKTKIGKDGPKRFSPGDRVAFHSRVLDGTTRVGDLFAECIVLTGTTFENVSGNCTGTFSARGSKLFVAVGGRKIFADKDVTGAVTGGTGVYAGATGTFVSPNTNTDTTTDTFTIYVPAGG